MDTLYRVQKLTEDISSVVTVPFEYDAITTPFPIIRVRIGKAEPSPVIFDTGTNAPLLIDIGEARSRGWRIIDDSRTGGAFAELCDSEAVVQILGEGANHLTVRLAKVPVADIGFFLKPLKLPYRRVIGVLGSPILSHIDAGFDFSRRQITMAEQLRTPSDTFILLPMTQRNGLYYIKAGIRDRYSRLTLNCLIDTGSAISQIPLDVARKIRCTDAELTDILTLAAGSREAVRLVLPELLLGKIAVRNVQVVSELNERMEQYDDGGLLGSDVLSLLQFTVSARRKIFAIGKIPAKHLLNPVAIGSIGISISQDKGGFFVAFVKRDSPAHKAGILAGDRILTVDGRFTDTLPTEMVERLVNGLAGTTADLTLQRGSHYLHVEVKRVPALSPKRKGFGLLTTRNERGNLLIRFVIHDSPASRANLREGDEIIQVDSKVIAKMSMEEIAELGHKIDQLQRVRLLVGRNGKTFQVDLRR